MTLISFVVPAFKVQGYLRECLDSILDQPFGDIEVIGVDDASPDDSGEILAEYALRDPRVRPVRLAENVGLGPARNIGLDRAVGEYVWFVDGDDWLVPGCLPHVADRLRDTAPDVLIVDHVRAHWNNVGTRSAMRDVFPVPPGATTFALRDRPETLKLLHTAWNRVVRREFLLERGLRFEPGWYEDVSFSYPALMAAERIGVLDRICLNYRQRRTGAITKTRGDRHFEVFAQWHRVFGLMDRWKVTGLRPAVFERMIWHYLTVLGNGDRIAPELRAPFFAQMHADYVRFLPPEGYPVPPGAEGLKHRLVAAGRWRTFSALREAHQAGETARRTARRARRRVTPVVRRTARRARDLALGEYYRAELHRPVDPTLAVYAAYWYRGYSCNPAAIYEAARRLAPQVRGVWIVRRDRVAALPPGVEYVVAGSREYHRVLARARWLVNNVNFPDFVRKRPGSVHVQTHHGTPVKVMGLDQQRYPVGAMGMNFAGLLRRVDRWDYSITSNSFSTQMWERAYPADYTTLEVGYPRNDRLALATAEDRGQVRAALGIAPDEYVVLYAPTHREHLPGWRPPFDPDRMLDVLGPRGRLLMRSHYFHDRERHPRGPAADGVLDVSAYDRVEDLYLAADVLITDYSSAMFDYAVLDRPIVVYAPDWDAYRVARGVYFDLLAEPPGAVALDFPGLLDLFRCGAVDDEAAERARTAFRSRFCALDDGHAAERVVRRVFLGETP
ncbi:bifunctional glycosyltransferase family 2 protein/CDP-glycerol:glycerophosphate glycerophosphotransferase [Micromonospora sp. WMMA1949]|uniref:bifunctional glycosyltransferase/CDP-glycerol:glycerophosphate glycerophosphotransferase n=1 Tax=unclassified Micromonospora TaxID=2617518 RepID=UPI0022B60D93|nr:MULTISPECIES: bifunctional glycosyltransferase family 2 protein/CDP-glycerol:glycerophosphate glycerophosphotransferase [unclassified Micromonospora]MCZ7426076.1 bifunctional glycosyltransferase family 2 protein/CDP-glycerol:glycerophosphate glycerophosphotransferase [Micromonospora sp. WMMA1949]WBC10624.1 bifunctional glycosyltransferase family 2 protein/CDP-glycerol:glycerophosphate glycerophosphotransferase [Micromonospora sp. WMMA1947]